MIDNFGRRFQKYCSIKFLTNTETENRGKVIQEANPFKKLRVYGHSKSHLFEILGINDVITVYDLTLQADFYILKINLIVVLSNNGMNKI